MSTIKKILVAGAFSKDPSIYTYALSFDRALQKLGYETYAFNTRRQIIPRPFSAVNAFLINEDLKKTAKVFKPDLIFLIKAETIKASTLAYLKQHVTNKLVNFYPDNPFAVWNGNSNGEVLKSLPLYTCFPFWSSTLISALQSAGCLHVCEFPMAYDGMLFNMPLPTAYNYAYDVSFVGTWEPDREAWLDYLKSKIPDLNLGIWGNDWGKFVQSKAIKDCIRGKAIYNHDMIAVLQSSKIVLNFIRAQNIDAHNMRTFEVPACGAFLLTQRTPQQAEIFFKEGDTLACFSTPEELVSQIIYYREHDNARERIAQQGHAHVQKYSLTKQLNKYLAQCHFLNT